ncbi:hypothetical protein ElyMa_006442200 [Elysia marginata]|uniref:Polycystin cation channel PKD1/PKD2 domain-containing protein n=1 Tax=Elysia marginata TaxID=1093978 RepID=A0AAV4HXI8_9GAST|nr:hypothetical protein ElyMa_006442200 [Elysia marginata]
MALLRRFFCWNLTTAVFANFVATVILSFGALLMRLLDLAAYADSDFEISQGFQSQWRSHQWQAFLASDIIVTFTHVVIILYSLYMLYMVTQKHFVLYMETLRAFTYTFIMYSFIEFCFSVFEFSFYGLNTFVLRKCWSWQNLDVALLKKLLSVSGCVSSCVVLLKNNISLHGGVRHHVSLKHILHVCLLINHPSIVEKNWPNPIIVRVSTMTINIR